MTDIDKLEINVLCKWILKQNIPTQGPLLAAKLFCTAELMREKALSSVPKEGTDVCKLINRYADCYEAVGMIEGITAGGVIDFLRELLEKDKG